MKDKVTFALKFSQYQKHPHMGRQFKYG